MHIAITASKAIKSKKGDSFVILSVVKPSGETAEIFLNEEQQRELGPALNSLAPSRDTLTKALSSLPVVEVEFNEKGRVETVSLP